LVQTIEQLGELDIKVLQVLNLVMNKPSDWSDQFGNPATKLHPNTFIQRRQELAVQIAQALGQKTNLASQVKAGQTYSHEEGYEICARLQGFGLAHEVPLSVREVPIGDYCFRPSKRGLPALPQFLRRSSVSSKWRIKTQRLNNRQSLGERQGHQASLEVTDQERTRCVFYVSWQCP
jgi:hypothetical protein